MTGPGILTAVESVLDGGAPLPERLGRCVAALVERGCVDVGVVAPLGGDPIGDPGGVGQDLAIADPDLLAATGPARDLLTRSGDSLWPAGGPAAGRARARLDLREVVVIPLVARGRRLGTLVAAAASSTATVLDAVLLREAGYRIAVAMDVAALLVDRREEAARQSVALSAAAALSAAVTPRQVADVAVAQLGAFLDTDSVAVFELRGRDSLDAVTLGGWVQAAQDAWTTMPLDAPAPVSDAARRREPVWSASGQAWHDAYPHLVGMLDEYGYTGVIGVPLLASGELVGALGIGFRGRPDLDGGERAIISAFAEQCAEALVRARMLRMESEARQTAELLTEMVGALAGARSPAQVATAIVRCVATLGAGDAVVVVRRGDELERVDGARGDPIPVAAAHPLAYAARTGDPVWLAQRSTLAWQDRSFDPATGTTVQVAVPMAVDDTVIGAIGMAFAGDVPAFSPNERSMIVTLAAQCAQALDRARLYQAEHEIAETLQRSLLPERLPEVAGVALAARYQPGRAGTQAGGDWYDVVALDGGRVAVTVGDVVGQGPAAAAVMGQLRTALSAAVMQGHGPAAALEQLDRFAEHIAGARASTAACVVLDPASGELRWARAGHLPALVVTNGDVRILDEDAHGPVLGLGGSRTAEERTLVLDEGATLLLYTDGLVERRDEDLAGGLARLGATLGRLSASAPDELATALLAEMGVDSERPDDVALIVARVLPPALSRRLPAEPGQLRAVRQLVHDWTTAFAADEDQADDLQLALGEALANAVEHAYGGRRAGAVELRLAAAPGHAVEVVVRDFGAWRPPDADPGFRGRGLEVIRSVGCEVCLEPGPDGTSVRFRVPAAEPGPRAPRAVAAAGDPGRTGVAAIEAHDGPAGVRLAVVGEVDMANAAELHRELSAHVRAAPAGTAVELDLRGTTYLPSAGVAMLLAVVGEARDRGLRVHRSPGPAPRTDTVLAVTGFDAQLDTPGRV